MSKAEYINSFCFKNERAYDIHDLDNDSIDLVYELYVNHYIDHDKKVNSNCANFIGLYYKVLGDKDNAIKYFLIAIDGGNAHAMFNLGTCYKNYKDYQNMVKYYIMAFNNGYNNVYDLTSYYEKCGDYDNMFKYHLMAINRGDREAMNNLGFYYERKKDYDNMLKYYLMAIDNHNVDAMYNLAYHYKNQEDYKNMTKYYLMYLNQCSFINYGPFSFLIKKTSVLNAMTKIYREIQLKKDQIINLNNEISKLI